MKFRSLCYVFIAILSLSISIPLTRLYGGIGCACSIALALLLGQGIIMNIYYWKKIKLDIPKFWKEIFKMSGTPLLLGLVGSFFVKRMVFDNIADLFVAIIPFSVLYLLLCWFIDMNQYEKRLFRNPVQKIFNKINVRNKKK
jgi:O-antigen/teichoic acid export membrane protein